MTATKQHNYKHILGMSATIAFIAAIGMGNQHKEDITPKEPNEETSYTQINDTNIPIKTATASFEQKAQQNLDITTESGHTLSFTSQESYRDYTLLLQDTTKPLFANYNGQVVPKDLRESALFTKKTLGIPPTVLLMIAQSESGFDGESKNPYSTGKGYFHLLKDPMLELIQKTIGTPLEHLFPRAKDIVKKTYNDRSYFYLTNPKTGTPDKALTMAYHEEISKDPFLSALTAGLKIVEDKRIVQRTSFGDNTTMIDSYAQYFYGGYGGKRYATLHRTEPDAPIWRIYGTDKATILRQKKAEIENKGNSDFFFNSETGDFKKIQEHVQYLKETRGIPDTQWSLLHADLDFAKTLKIKDDLSPFTTKREKVFEPKAQVSLLKQAVN